MNIYILRYSPMMLSVRKALVGLLANNQIVNRPIVQFLCPSLRCFCPLMQY